MIDNINKYEHLNEEFEEHMRRRYGGASSGSGGKNHPDHHGRKTEKYIQKEIVQHSIEKQARNSEEEIFKVLIGFPEFTSKDLEDRYVDKYLNWIKTCFEEKKLILNPTEDISLKFARSSSHGGQNVNKVETAVRALHKITNIQVKNEEYADQTDNRREAVKLLINRLKNHLVDWKNYLGNKNVHEINRYDILDLMEKAFLEREK